MLTLLWSRARVVSRLLDLPFQEIGDLVVAQTELLRARIRLARAPMGTLVRPVSMAEPSERVDELRLARLARAIERAANHGLFNATCLVRAVALERMIARLPEGRGSAVVRVGVRPDGDKLLAHAWIMSGDRVLGDSPARVAGFTPLHDFSGLCR